MSKNDTSITSDKRKKMPPRGKAKKTLMLDAIRAVCESETEFLEQTVRIGLGGLVKVGTDENDKDVMEYKNPNPVLLTLILNRIEPPLKAVSQMVNFKFRKDAKPHEQAVDIMVAVACGSIAPDIGQMFVSSIKSMIEIEEYTDLKERIEAIEKSLGVSND